LPEEQITALIENNKVIGLKKDVLEVLNANKVFKKLKTISISQTKVS
jgi:hypothetical protein